MNLKTLVIEVKIITIIMNDNVTIIILFTVLRVHVHKSARSLGNMVSSVLNHAWNCLSKPFQ